MDPLASLVESVLKKLLPDSADLAIRPNEPKIVRDAVWGMVELLRHECLIVDTPLFQRLRGVFQTGFTYLVYPCAVHSRFEHSLGCLHLAARVIDRLATGEWDTRFSLELRLMVRLAALLHDVSHCVFSHVSEDVYRRDSRVRVGTNELRKLFPQGEKSARIGAAEVLTYYMLTSKAFGRFFENVRKAVGDQCLPSGVTCENIARLIIGLPPKEHADFKFVSQIINGPFDIDKVDYQTRDGYFTGVTMPVDKERLVSSLCICDNKRGQYEMVVDHRGIAPIEQLLFNRMLLYDSAYHHHKIRAATKLFERAVDDPAALPLEWLLEHDEYDFFGLNGVPRHLYPVIRRLRHRNIPFRAAIIHGSSINPCSDEDSTDWKRIIKKLFSPDEVDQDDAKRWFDELDDAIRRKLGKGLEDSFYVDLPKPPKYMTIQQGSKIKFSDGHLATLDEVFPLNSTLNTYAQQCKYRIYVFAEEIARYAVAAAAYSALKDVGIQLNKDAFRLAKLDPERVRENLNGEAIPDRASDEGSWAFQ